MDHTATINKSLEVLEATVSPSGRPKRQPKPKNYSDEFYTFDSHGRILPANFLSPQTVEMHRNFTTSTPVKQTGLGKQGRARKPKSIESLHPDNVDSRNIPDSISPVVQQTGTSDTVLTASHSAKQKAARKMFTAVSKTDNQDVITNKNVIAHTAMENGQHNNAEETKNNESDFKSPKMEKSRSRQSRKKTSVLKEEETKILYSKTDAESRSLKGSNKERRSDIILPKGHTSNDVKKDSSKQIRANKKSLDNTAKRETKKRKIDNSCVDSCLKENVISETQSAESCEVNKLNRENRNLLDADITDSVNAVEKMCGMVVDKSVAAENGTEEETSCNLNSSGNVVSNRKERKGSNESNTPLLTQEALKRSPLDTGISPASVKKQRGRQRPVVSKDLQIESPKVAATHVAQKTPRRKLSVKKRSEFSAALVCDEPEGQSSAKNIGTVKSEEIHRERNSTTNVHAQLQDGKPEHQFESTAASVPQKRSQRRPPMYMPQERTVNKSPESTEIRVTQVGSHNVTNVDPQLLEANDEAQCESSVAFVTQTRLQGRQPKNVSEKSYTRLDPQSPEVEGETQCENISTPSSRKRQQGRAPKCASQNSKLSSSPNTTTTDLIQVEDCSVSSVEPGFLGVKHEKQYEDKVLTTTTKKRRGRPPIIFPIRQQTTTPDSTHVEGHSVASAEPQLWRLKEELCEEKVDTTTQPKRRGRPPSILPVQRQTVPMQVQHVNSENSPYPCHSCGLGMATLSAIKHHMMTEHSLMWSPEYPQGLDSPYYIIKTLGHIICQRCKREFRFAHYYKHHQIWCGREDEMATCDICRHCCRAMWMQQHMAAHRTQEKKLARLGLQDLKQDNDHSEEEDVDSGAVGKRSRRKAARNAIKLMSSLRDDTEEQQALSGGSCVEVSGEESSDDDDDSDEDDDEEENSDQDEEVSDSEEKTAKVKRKARKFKVKITGKKPEVNKMEQNSDSQTSDSGKNIWLKACYRYVGMTTNKRLQFLHQMYNDQPQDKVFPDLCPKQTDWKRLAGSEVEQYLPVHKESLKFTFEVNSKKMEDGEHSLKFGHTLLHNGTSYCYTGGPVWAVEWCPIRQGLSKAQFLAVSAGRSTEELRDVATLKDGPSLTQIWSAGSLADETNCCAEPVLQYAIAHDSGSIHAISWCPRGCFDVSADHGYLKRLGLFAAACSDGRVLIYCPPQPEELEHESSCREGDNAVPVFRPQPALVLTPNLRKGCGPCVSVAWQQGSEVKCIIAGYGQGVIYLWDISSSSPLLRVDASTLRPARCFSFHTEAVVSIAWNSVAPSVFVTVSLDFHCCLWNMDCPDPSGIIRRMVHNMPRSVCWAGPCYNGYFTAYEKLTGYEETPVCYYGLSKTVVYTNLKAMTVQYHRACTWDVTYSPFYEAIVTCDACGIVKFAILPMRDMICQKAGKTAWHRSRSHTVNIYQARLVPKALPSYRQLQTLPSAKNICQRSSTADNNCNQSSTSNRNKDRNTSVTVDNAQHVTESYTCVNPGNQLVPHKLSSRCTNSKSTVHVNCDEHIYANTPARVDSESDSPTAGSAGVKGLPANIQEHASMPDNLDNDSITNAKKMQPDAAVNSAGNSSTDSTLSADVTGAGLTAKKPSQSDRSVCPENISDSVKPPENIVLASSSSFIALGDSKLKTNNAQEAAQEMIHFLNCEMKTESLKPVKAKFDEKPRIDALHDSNANAVHKVRLNPNPGCCLWLASGGQSGILRLDNLKGLVKDLE